MMSSIILKKQKNIYRQGSPGYTVYYMQNETHLALYMHHRVIEFVPVGSTGTRQLSMELVPVHSGFPV